MCPRPLVALFALSLLVPSTAFAQGNPSANATRWGLRFSVSPAYEMTDFLLIFFDKNKNTVLDFGNTEFAIGFVRGSQRGGDWGVSFVRKRFKDGLVATQTETQCFNPGQGFPEICNHHKEVVYFDKVVVSGVEMHWFIPFFRIKDRVQIGLNLGGGAGSVAGTSFNVQDKEDTKSDCSVSPCRQFVEVTHTEETFPATEDIGFKTYPLLQAEAQGAIILGRAFKLQVAAGLNFPSVGVRVAGVYFFGAK